MRSGTSKTAPSVREIKYHVNWLTRYRYKVLRGMGVGPVATDLVHMLVSVPWQLTPAKPAQASERRVMGGLPQTAHTTGPQDDFNEDGYDRGLPNKPTAIPWPLAGMHFSKFPNGSFKTADCPLPCGQQWCTSRI
jgi:hypothetical protein